MLMLVEPRACCPTAVTESSMGARIATGDPIVRLSARFLVGAESAGTALRKKVKSVMRES
jgi:hypothetical protein